MIQNENLNLPIVAQKMQLLVEVFYFINDLRGMIVLNTELDIKTRLTTRFASFWAVTLLVVFLVGCTDPAAPSESELYAREVEGNVFDTTPVHGEARALKLRRTGFEYSCAECHTDFEHEPTSNKPQGEHANIMEKFDHGSTIYCMSCHYTKDREKYVDNIGQPMDADKSEILCARCHGPKFRDWKNGIHGRINGFWSEDYGDREKLTCAQCHDPHTPKFPKMVPSPPPIRSRLEAAHGGEAHGEAEVEHAEEKGDGHE